MKTLSNNMTWLLNNLTAVRRMDLITITLTTGEILRYTTADANLTYNGKVYKRMPLKRGQIKQAAGLSVDDLDLEIDINPGNITAGNNSLAYAAQVGAFDVADTKVETMFLSDWNDTTAGTIQRFEGQADIYEMTGTVLKLKIKSITERLNQQLPRNIYSPSCGYALYGQGCGANRDAFGLSSQVTSDSTRSMLVTTATLKTDGYLNLGYVLCTIGNNAGATRTIKSHVGTNIYLSYPLDADPTTGDSYVFYPGCDGTTSTCSGKFNNSARNRSFPFVPVPEVVVG